jgi:acetyltransferase
MGRKGLSEWRAELHDAGIPTYIFPESAARAIAALNRYREMSRRPRETPAPLPVDLAAAAAVIADARREGRLRLSELQALALLEAYGIPVTRARFASSREAAVAAACELGFPVVMKIVSPDIAHKTDAGGVALGITDEHEATVAYDRIISEAGHRAAGARVEGVLVARQVDAEGARETIVGMARDPLFGPLVMFGLGGIYAEALRDVVFRIAPLTWRDARDMVSGIRGAAVLDGVRGQPAVDRERLHDVIRRVAQLAADFPEISELDVNPVLAFEHHVVAVDCRVLLSAAAKPAEPV